MVLGKLPVPGRPTVSLTKSYILTLRVKVSFCKQCILHCLFSFSVSIIILCLVQVNCEN